MKIGKRIEIGLKKALFAVIRLILPKRTCPVDTATNRILFLRYGRIGDIILSMPVWRATRRKNPDATIDVLCDRRYAGLLEGTGLVDSVFFYEKNPLDIVRLIRQLRQNRYDRIINLVAYPSFTFGLLARLIGPNAVRAAGDQGQYAYFFNREICLPPKMETHMLRRLFLIAAEVAGPEVSETATPWVKYDQSTCAAAAALRYQVHSMIGSKGDRPRLAGVNLTAGLTRREWPVGRYRELLQYAVDNHRDRIDGWVVFSDPGRPEMAEELVKSVERPEVVVLKVQHDFRVLIEFLHHLEILITPDTSLAHAASATGTPVLDLMIGENIHTWVPYEVIHRVVASADPLSLHDLPVADVRAALDDLLNEPGDSAG